MWSTIPTDVSRSTALRNTKYFATKIFSCLTSHQAIDVCPSCGIVIIMDGIMEHSSWYRSSFKMQNSLHPWQSTVQLVQANSMFNQTNMTNNSSKLLMYSFLEVGCHFNRCLSWSCRFLECSTLQTEMSKHVAESLLLLLLLLAKTCNHYCMFWLSCWCSDVSCSLCSTNRMCVMNESHWDYTNLFWMASCLNIRKTDRQS